MIKRIFWIFPVFILLLSACEDYQPYPRPYGFHRIDVPNRTQRVYQTFENETCPFTFEYPTTGTVTRNQTDSCWVDIHYADFDLKWHLSYRNPTISGMDRSANFEDYRRLIYKHAKKADRILENPISTEQGYGIMFEIIGNVGTPAQIFFSDSAGQNIAMMSCYFQTAEKGDSLAPVTDYMKEEIKHMVSSLRWK